MDTKEKIAVIMQGLGINQISDFFHMIFMWKYKDIGDISNDVVLYEQLGTVPEYVADFLASVRRRQCLTEAGRDP